MGPIAQSVGRLRLRQTGLKLAATLLSLLPCLAIAAAKGPATEPKRVLIVESFGRDVSPWNAITPAFKTELARRLPAPIEFNETAVETARKDEPQAELAFAGYLRALYARDEPDLIVPVGGPAAQFWWRHRAALFPATPVVIGGIESRVLKALTLNSNDAAVGIQFDLAHTGPEVVLQLLPATTNIAVVVGDSMLERFWVAECRQAWVTFSNRVELVWFNKLPFPEMCRRAATMPPRSALAYGVLFVDAAGVPQERMQALDQLCAVANAPVFGLFEEQLGHGIVGGRLFSSETVGRETAGVAARVLRGESVGNLPTLLLPAGPPTFDWRQLQRWGIDERRLPPQSIVRFRQPSAWERYRWYVFGVIGIILLQALTIVALLAQRTWRRRAESAAQRHRDELLHIGRVQMLGQLSCALGHELNQPLGAILSNAEAAELLLQRRSPDLREVREILADIRNDDQHASEVIHRMRTLLRRHEMELEPLSAEELIAECITLARSDAIERKVTIGAEVVPGTPRVRGDRVHLEQVLLNLLVNSMDAMRDCPAERRRLRVRGGPGDKDTVIFSVEDSGPGVPPDQLEHIFDSFHTTKPNGLGVGLSISRTIIEAHHGRIWAENNAHGGAIFRFTLPVADGDKTA